MPLSNPSPHSAQSLLVAVLVTVGFVACGSSKRSLNTTTVGDGGEEGTTPGGGSGGSSAAGKGSGAHAGRPVGETGGGGPIAGSGAGPRGGSSNAGSAGGAGSPQGGSAGFPSGGVPNGGVGATAGFAGSSGGGTGPTAGSAGSAGYPCDSSDGTGCNGRGFCVDHEQDSCAPDYTSDCSGTCAVPHLAPVCSGFQPTPCPSDFECIADFDTYFGTDPTSICVGGRTPGCDTSDDCNEGFTCRESGGEKRCLVDSAQCWPPDACDTLVPTCPAGYAPADAQVCDYVCVPVQHCGCEKDLDCQQPYSCDREHGRCAIPVAPAPRCSQPFDAGPCDAIVPAFAFVDGECKAVTYGGCEGNDNRFVAYEDCLAACEGMPQEAACGEGRVPQVGCLACGGGGGCTLQGMFCFESCETSDDCTTPGFSCSEGVCQVVGCF